MTHNRPNGYDCNLPLKIYHIITSSLNKFTTSNTHLEKIRENFSSKFDTSNA